VNIKHINNHAKMKKNSFLQTKLDNTENPKQVQREVKKQFLYEKAYHNFEQFIFSTLASTENNSLSLSIISTLMNHILKKMEQNGACYLKVINGKARLYKKYYCCFRIEEWKKCTLGRCIALPCNEDSLQKCPNHLTPEFKGKTYNFTEVKTG
jgi:hypothetical protein